MEVFPNPIHDVLRIVLKLDLVKQSQLEIIDIYGRIIKQEFLKKGLDHYEINSSGIEPGVYLLRLSDEDGVIDFVKIVKGE